VHRDFKRMLFVKVSDSENDESVEIPVEPQGFILMTTLTAQFPGACGLKFKTEQFSWRGYVKLQFRFD
jgi:hypothetical protein